MQARIGACALRYEIFDAHQYARLATPISGNQNKIRNPAEMQE